MSRWRFGRAWDVHIAGTSKGCLQMLFTMRNRLPSVACTPLLDRSCHQSPSPVLPPSLHPSQSCPAHYQRQESLQQHLPSAHWLKNHVIPSETTPSPSRHPLGASFPTCYDDVRRAQSRGSLGA
eukprot:4651137-Amphidinium_carterae.1